MLYLIATPLGNIQDITLRALELLKKCDLILCEDTRHSKKLLNHFEISTKAISYHKFNEMQKLDQIISSLKDGLDIALISDAGTPCIQDPGMHLVKRCFEENIEISSVPGPSALTLAMSLSGLEGPFQFIGFLPKKEKELTKVLLKAFTYEGQSISYVSSHQIVKVIETIQKLDSSRPLFLAKELTKLYEHFYKGFATDILNEFQTYPPKGEFVLLIEQKDTQEDFSKISIEEHVKMIQEEYGLTQNEAIKYVAKQRKVHKSVIYKEIHNV